MDTKRILCPVDFSSASDAALDLASKLARETGAKLFIIHIEDSAAVVSPGLFGNLPPTTNIEDHRLAKTLPTATEVSFEHDLLFGDPADEIVEFANKKDIDLIVMGSHGRTGLLRMLMGSVAEGVIRNAPVPVLSLKPDSKHLMDSPSEEVANEQRN